MKKFKGQGLLETVVAIGIIVTGLFSVISLVISNLTAERETAIRFQAVNFAREGIELVRNLRDSNWIAGDYAWSPLGIESREEGVSSLIFDPDGSNVIEYDLATSSICKADSGLFTQGGTCASPSLFSRQITLHPLDCSDIWSEEENICSELILEDLDGVAALEITSRVTWMHAGRDQQIELTEVLYDWR